MIKYIIAILFTGSFLIPAWSQYQNIYFKEGNLVNPGVVINPLNIDQFIVSAGKDKIYTSNDGGATWNQSDVKSTFGVNGNGVVKVDKKGQFYYFHYSNKEGEGWEKDKIGNVMVTQVSDDEGETWSDGGYYGNNLALDRNKPGTMVHAGNNDLIATWTDFDNYGSEDVKDKSNIMISYSSNRGKKWDKPFRLNFLSGDCLGSNSTTMGSSPTIGFAGQVFAVWAFNEKIYFDRSFDQGKTWLTNDIKIADQPGGWDIHIPGLAKASGLPTLISDISLLGYRGNIYVVWADQRNGEDDTDIWIIRSNSNGDRWNRPVRVNDDEAGKHQFSPAIAVDQVTGYIYVLFYDRRNFDNDSTEVYVAYSNKGGESFTNVKISEKPFDPGPESSIGNYINIAAQQGKIVAVWIQAEGAGTSMVVSAFKQEALGLPELRMPEIRKKKKKKKKKEDSD